jgi:nucleoid-associated protein YgaU
MTYPPYEALVRRAVRDHHRTARAAHAQWVMTGLTAPLETAAARDALCAGYSNWLRMTATAGIAGALLVTSPGVSSAAAADQAPSSIGIPEDQPPPAANPADPAGQTDPAFTQAPYLAPSQTDGASHAPAAPVVPGPASLPPERTTQMGQAMQEGAEAEDAQAPQREPTPSPAAQPEAQPEVQPKMTMPRGTEPLATQADPSRAQPHPAPAPAGAPAQAPPAPTPERIDQWITSLYREMGRDAGSASDPGTQAETPALTTHPERAPAPAIGWSYEIQRGDSLWHISEQLWPERPSNKDVDRTWRALYEWNHTALGPDPDMIHPGQVLEIPVEAGRLDAAPVR